MSQPISRPKGPKSQNPATGRVKDLVGYLYKAVKTILLYPPTNSLPGEFKAQLHEKLSAYLGDEDALTLVIRGDQFLFDGDVVHEEAGGEDNFIATLHRDGIQKISFHSGLELEELDLFLSIVKKIIAERTQDDDLVTLLWEASFVHIKYEAISELDDVDYEVIENKLMQKQAEIESQAGFVDYQSVVLEELDEGSGDDSTQAQEEGGESRSTALDSVDISKIVEDLNELSDDMSQVDTYLREAAQFDAASSTIGIVFEILIGEEEIPGFRETCGVVDNLYDRFIQQADFKSAVRMLHGIQELEATEAEHSPARVKRLAESRMRTADKLRIDQIVAALNGHPGCDVESCRGLLQGLPVETLPYLVGTLGDLEHFATRSMMCDTLAERGAERIDTIGNGVFDKRWYVVRNIVVILGNIGGPRALYFLEKAVKHSDERVRREVIEALVRMDPSSSSHILRVALLDKNPELRIVAIRALSTRSDDETAAVVRTRITGSSFKKLEPTEQKELLGALARIQGDEAIPVFRKLIGGFGWFDHAGKIRLKTMATVAMAEGEGPELMAYLDRLTVDKQERIRDAARRALSRMHAGQSET